MTTRFKIGDREYDFDGNFTLEEAMVFFDKANIGVTQFNTEMMRGNPYVTVTLMYVLKKRAGEAVRWEDLKHYALTDFTILPDNDDEEDPDDAPTEGAASGEAPDPTEDAGTTPEPDTTST